MKAEETQQIDAGVAFFLGQFVIGGTETLTVWDGQWASLVPFIDWQQAGQIKRLQLWVESHPKLSDWAVLVAGLAQLAKIRKLIDDFGRCPLSNCPEMQLASLDGPPRPCSHTLTSDQVAAALGSLLQTPVIRPTARLAS